MAAAQKARSELGNIIDWGIFRENDKIRKKL